MSRLLLLIGAAVALLLSGAAGAWAQVTTPAAPSATPVGSELGDDLQAILDRHVAASPSIPGLILAVDAPAIGFAWSGAAGLFDRATGKPLRPDHVVRIASNTKTYTAAATLRLVEEGALGLDDPIASLLPAEYVDLLAADGYDPAAITVRHLLHHTSGLYDYATDPRYAAVEISQPDKRWTRLEQVRFATDNGDPVGQPGERFNYADTGYILLGEIVERASALSQADAYRELLGFERLGLTATYLETLEPEPAGAPDRAHQYSGEIDTFALDPSVDLYGGGGLVANAPDLVRFYRALLGGEVFADPATLETMLTIPRSNTSAEAAMGLFRFAVAGETCWGHGGYWGTTAASCPDSGLTIAFSINQVDAPDFDYVGFVDQVFAVVAGAGGEAAVAG